MTDPACTEVGIVELEDATAAWGQVAFPFHAKFGYNKSYDRYRNMKMIKSMLLQMELKPYQDFVFDSNRTFEHQKNIVVKFKDEGNATIAIIKWLGSDWYNGRIS